MNYPVELQIRDRAFCVNYEIVRKATSSVRIRKGAVHIKLSRFAFGRQRDEIVERFLKWAQKKLQKASPTDFIEPVYEDGGRICTHNRIYEIAVYFDEKSSARAEIVDGFLIEITLPDDFSENLIRKKIKFLAEKIIMEDQIGYLKEVLDELNELYFKEKFGIFRFKRMNSRFGSCSSKRNINIAFRLLFAPREVFRYVCAHELAHLKEFNHSKRFWDLVAEAVPDFLESEKWLKNSGFMLG